MTKTSKTSKTVKTAEADTTTAAQSAAEQWQDADDLRWAARHWAVRIGVKTPRIQVRQMTTKWASISTAGRLTLNTDLLDVPKDLGDFVIVHELVHLLAPNHGRVFKSFMHAYLPDWQQRERALRGYTDEQATSREGSTDLDIHRRPSRQQRSGHDEGSSARRGR